MARQIDVEACVEIGAHDLGNRRIGDREILVAHSGCLHARREGASWDCGTAGRHSLSARKLASAQKDQGKNEDSGMNCES